MRVHLGHLPHSSVSFHIFHLRIRSDSAANASSAHVEIVEVRDADLLSRTCRTSAFESVDLCVVPRIPLDDLVYNVKPVVNMIWDAQADNRRQAAVAHHRMHQR